MRLGAIIVAGLWLALGTAAHAAEADGRQPLPQDPTIHRGVLANGLRYAIKANPSAQGGLSFRLAFDVGSLVEAEDERGAAHFVEHMAFRATRSFPEGELDPAFAPIGVSFGRDQNAFTSLESTLYLVDLPRDGARERALAFQWLRDIADGVRFEAAAVDRERGVVLAERNARGDTEALVRDAVTNFQMPELLAPKRSPIGSPATIQAMAPQDLEAFYRRWYRPERAVLVIVGDVANLPALEADISRAFADWRPAAPEAAPTPSLAQPDLRRGPDAFVLPRSEISPSLAVCRVGPPQPRERRDLAAMRRFAVRAVWLEALNNRLARLALNEPAIVGAESEFIAETPEADKVCVSALISGEDWARQLAAVQDEIRSFSERDVTEDELDTAIRSVRGGLLGYVESGFAATSSDLASGIVRSLLANDVIMNPRQTLWAFNQAIIGLDPAQLRAAWNTNWSGAGPLIILVTPKPPSREAILAAWDRNQQSELAMRTSATLTASADRWAYGVFDQPGAVMNRETFLSPDFVRLHFANGVVLNFKQSKAAKGKAELVIDFGGGREELGARHLDEARLAADFFVVGGLGRHSYVELKAMFGEEPLRFQLGVAPHSFEIFTDAFASQLPSQLQLIATYFRDPGFRADLDGKIPPIVALANRQLDTSPTRVALEALRASQGPGATLARSPETQMAALRAPDFAALLRGPVTTAPIEITLVGDLTEAEAAKWVAESFGALPERAAGPVMRSKANFQRFPDAVPAPIQVTHKGPAGKAGLVMAWPTFVGDAAQRREAAALRLLAAIFDDAARHSIRERLGKSYAPEVVLADRVEQADQGHIRALVESTPADLPIVEAELRKVAASLAGGAITPQMLEAARAPLLSHAQANLQDPAWIVGHLRYSSREPDRPQRLFETPQTLTSLSLDDVKRAAATWLAPTPIIVTAVPETLK